MKKYPDISAILTAKRENRHRLAKLPFEEKIEIVRRLQRLSAEIKKEAERLKRNKAES